VAKASAIIAAEVRLGEALVASGNSAEAETLLRQAVSSASEEPFPLPSWQIAEANNAYGECLKNLGRAREAEPRLRESLGALQSDPRPAFRAGPIARLIRKRPSAP